MSSRRGKLNLRNRNRKGPPRRRRSPGALTSLPSPDACDVNLFGKRKAPKVLEVQDNKVTRQERDILSAKINTNLNNLPQLEIEEISFNLISHEELEKIAVFSVKSDKPIGNNTVNDPRSGVIDNYTVCSTCHADNLSCPGHLGIIELNKYIIHPMFKRELIDVLSSVCNSCGGLLLHPDTIKTLGITDMTGSKRLRMIAENSTNVTCRRSQENVMAGATECVPNPIFRTTKIKETRNIFYKKSKDSKENIMAIGDILAILDAISDEDAKLLGFEGSSHPRNFILKSLPVIPICSRAPVIQDGMILKDDITSIYLDIVRHNNALANKDLSENEAETILGSLTFSIEHLLDNSDNRYRPGKKKTYMDIRSRIQGKEGIIRKYIQGKRVNYSGRTVLGPDPSLKFGEIRIPRAWASFLTFPETVDSSNIGWLTSLLRSGHITHVTPSEGHLKGRYLNVTQKMKENYNLRFGDIAERWLQDGDYVVFNRQPSLHKYSIMGYKVKLGDGLTIGLHLSYTPPHNADFDGDEGTIHVPQSKEAMMEVATIMFVKKCLMNSQKNKNIIGAVMDTVSGAYLLTQPETIVKETVFGNIVSFLENKEGLPTLEERLNKYYIPENSGRALFSSILPPDFYYRKGDVIIKEGILVNGIITEDHIGSAHGSIIQVMYNDYNEDITADYITDLYYMVGEWLNSRGFSVGLDDCLLSGDKPEQSIEFEVQRAKMLVESMGWKLDDPLEEERREKQIVAYLNNVKGLGARISDENLPVLNAFNVMAKSGAKGSTFNIAQITGMLGQQFVQGQRMPEAITDGTRCIPYFPPNSLDPAARGFCKNSFRTGLSPAEFFFHQAGGREGLTDTAVKTADTGHIYHRTIKALEDVKVVDDGSVRGAGGTIFEFSYGEDGFAAEKLESVSTKTGSFASFINIKRLAGRLNLKYGYDVDPSGK